MNNYFSNKVKNLINNSLLSQTDKDSFIKWLESNGEKRAYKVYLNVVNKKNGIISVWEHIKIKADFIKKVEESSFLKSEQKEMVTKYILGLNFEELKKFIRIIPDKIDSKKIQDLLEEQKDFFQHVKKEAPDLLKKIKDSSFSYMKNKKEKEKKEALEKIRASI